jgi:predicted transcriptional regulator
MKRYNFYLPDELVEKLKVIAKERHTTLSEVIRQAIIYFVRDDERVPRFHD